MGFFQRLVQTFRLKIKPEIVTPVESRSTHTTASAPLQPVVPAVVASTANVLEPPVETSASNYASAVAVAEMPENGKSSDTQAEFDADPSGIAHFPEVAAAAAAGLDRPAETNPAMSVMAVAVAAMPETGESREMQVEFGSDPSGSALFDADFDQDLDDAFASLVSKEVSPEAQSVSEEMSAADQSSVEDLFADIAANHARPVKNFIFELKHGTATRDWIEVCIPAMHGITRAAEGMGLTYAAKCMVDFERALSQGQSSIERVLNGQVRDLLLERYEHLIEVMPKAFFVAEEEQQREAIIINSLLRQVPGVGRLTVEKIYRAGLTSIDALQVARADELAVATGISSRLSERICAKFQAYRARLENNHRDPADLGQRARLTKMVDELRSYHEDVQRASGKGFNLAAATEKRDHRQHRESCLLRINVLLAEEGEVDLVDQLKKLTFERRIRRLEEYLSLPVA